MMACRLFSAKPLSQLMLAYCIVANKFRRQLHQSSTTVFQENELENGGRNRWPFGLHLRMMTSSNGNIFRVTGHLCGGIHRAPMNSPHKGQWHGALVFSWICAWIICWVNNGDAGDLRRHRTHYDVTVMVYWPGYSQCRICILII